MELNQRVPKAPSSRNRQPSEVSIGDRGRQRRLAVLDSEVAATATRAVVTI